jgi:hypothetical protein
LGRAMRFVVSLVVALSSKASAIAADFSGDLEYVRKFIAMDTSY